MRYLGLGFISLVIFVWQLIRRQRLGEKITSGKVYRVFEESAKSREKRIVEMLSWLFVTAFLVLNEFEIAYLGFNGLRDYISQFTLRDLSVSFFLLVLVLLAQFYLMVTTIYGGLPGQKVRLEIREKDICYGGVRFHWHKISSINFYKEYFTIWVKDEQYRFDLAVENEMIRELKYVIDKTVELKNFVS